MSTAIQAPGSRPAISAAPDKRVLFISYPFPPVGGAGVQRTTKFVKYLPACGWLPSVLTVANPSVPAFDDSLVKDIPEETLVRRARTWEPGYAVKTAVIAGGTSEGRRRGGLGGVAKGLVRGLAKSVLQPDPQVLWLPGAVREGKRLLRDVPHAAIVASGPPFSTFLIGARLSRATGVPLVLDYRDEWDISSAYWENKGLGRASHAVQTWMQHRAARAARVLLATTQASAAALETTRQRAGSTARVECIYNGFDPDDFPPAPAAAPPGPYRLAYVGTLWNLTSVAPLVEAVSRLAERSPDLAADLELVFAGRRTEPQQQLLGRLRGLPCRLVEHPYLSHDQALDLIRSADGLCALLSDLPHAQRVVPAKIFEYMAARRPVLAIGPEGEMWGLLREYPAAYTHAPADVGGVADSLAREIRRRRAGKAPAFGGWDGARYGRPSQARQLAGLLEALLPATRDGRGV
jgi:glycosyltransferase involved in cell wall biosynthesis